MSERTIKEILQTTIRNAKFEEKDLEDGQAVIDIIEKRLINATCEDIGRRLTQLFLFPRLQERIEAEAKRAADERTAKAEKEENLLKVLHPMLESPKHIIMTIRNDES